MVNRKLGLAGPPARHASTDSNRAPAKQAPYSQTNNTQTLAGGLLSLDGGWQAAGGSASQIATVQAHFSVPLLQILCETHWGRQVYTNHWRNWELGGTWGPIYKIPYDLSHDYRKFVVKSTYDSDLKRAEISLRNIVS